MFRAKPTTKSTLLAWNQVINPPRQKPDSARSILSDLLTDPQHFLHTASLGVLIGGPEPRAKKFVAEAEDVEGQVASAVIVTVKEPLLLVTMWRMIGGIQLEHGSLRRCGEALC